MRTEARIAFALASLIALGAVYVFLATAGHMNRFPHLGGGHYEQLAVAFVDGHLDLIQRPDPAKSAEALRDDYWDLSLYGGRLYLYWGPAPALIDAAILRLFAFTVPDDPLTVAFALGRAALGTLLLVRAKELFFRRQPWWPTALGVLTLALGAPMTLVLARPDVYEAAIMGGQCFVVAGTYAAFVALTRKRDSATRWLLGLSGTLFTLGVASRLGLTLAVVGVVALTIAETAADAPRRARLRTAALDGAALATPLALGMMALGAYNRARFGSAFDSGLHRQISQWSFHSGARFILPNLYSYVAKPPEFVDHFPFFRVAVWDGFPLWHLMPDMVLDCGDYLFESNAGLLWTTPFYAFAFVAWAALARWSARAARRGSRTPAAPAPRLAWLVAVSLLLAVVTMAPCLVAFVSAVRYLGDGATGLAIAATLGLSLLVARPVRSRLARGALAALASAAVAASVVVNLGVWVDGPYGNFVHGQNAPLFDSLSRVFSRGGSG